MTRTRTLAGLAGLAAAALVVAGIGTAGVAFAAGPADPTTTTAAAAPATSLDDARGIAVAHLGGGTATKVEREVEHGREVWEVDVVRDAAVTEVHVDTATGAVSRVETDRDDRWDDDDRGGDDRGRHGGDDDGPDHGRDDDHGRR